MAADLPQRALLLPAQPVEVQAQAAEAGWRWVRRYWLAVTGALILAIIVGLTAAAPATARHDPLKIDPVNKLQGPSAEFLMGTDDLGRSIWARVIWGARLTLGTATLAQLIMTAIGVTVGLVAGFYGGWLDNLIMRLVDIVLAVPSLILALAIAGMLGPSLINVLIGIVAVAWAEYARLVRGMVLSVRECEYVEAAKALGVRAWTSCSGTFCPTSSRRCLCSPA
jgi:peptide/nickel transport system permease protein